MPESVKNNFKINVVLEAEICISLTNAKGSARVSSNLDKIGKEKKKLKIILENLNRYCVYVRHNKNSNNVEGVLLF